MTKHHKTEPINWKYVRIGECELTARTFNLLRINGMEILGEVAERSDSELLNLTGFGRKSLREVKELLAAFKRSMPDETWALTWRTLLEPLLKKNGEKLDGVVFEWGDLLEDDGPLLTDEAELDRVFHPATGRTRGRPFHAYTKRYIYFVVKQEDGEFIRCIPKYTGSGSKPIHF